MTQQHGIVYLIHFDAPYKHARHYIGFTFNKLEQRIASHRNGTGARLMKVVTLAGITWCVVARTWENQTRSFERRLKRRKHSALLCPKCRTH
jgi:predicted GIY-YIG superfamily endonuclease